MRERRTLPKGNDLFGKVYFRRIRRKELRAGERESFLDDIGEGKRPISAGAKFRERKPGDVGKIGEPTRTVKGILRGFRDSWKRKKGSLSTPEDTARTKDLPLERKIHPGKTDDPRGKGEEMRSLAVQRKDMHAVTAKSRHYRKENLEKSTVASHEEARENKNNEEYLGGEKSASRLLGQGSYDLCQRSSSTAWKIADV